MVSGIACLLYLAVKWSLRLRDTFLEMPFIGLAISDTPDASAAAPSRAAIGSSLYAAPSAIKRDDKRVVDAFDQIRELGRHQFAVKFIVLCQPIFIQRDVRFGGGKF